MHYKRTYLYFIIFIQLFIPLFTFSQIKEGWNSHFSYEADITSLIQNENIIYALTDGKLFLYNYSDESLDEYIKESGNTNITHIAYNSNQECLFITRSDANIDLLYDNLSYKNIPDLKNYTAQNIDKTINSIYIEEDLAYLATNFGFTIIDVKNTIIKESGIFNIPFYSICSNDNFLYASTANGIYTVDKNLNIMDFSNWKQFPVSNFYNGKEYKFEDNEIRNITFFKDKLYFSIPAKTEPAKPAAFYIMENAANVELLEISGEYLTFLKTDNNHLITIAPGRCRDYEDLSQYITINIENTQALIPNGNKQEEYWLASSGNNLSLIKNIDSGIEFTKQYIRPQGPASNFPFSQTFANNQLIVTGGGFYSNRYNYPASISIFKNSKWNNASQNTIYKESGIYAQDFVYAISDPLNPSRIFASSWGEGLYEFENNRFMKLYDNTNSTIRELVTEDDYRTTRVSGMAFDKNNNLWLLNSMVKDVVNVYRKDGEWTSLYYPEISYYMKTNPKNIFIDKYSNKWITTIIEEDYIFIFNENGTISDTSDDRYKFINKDEFVDQNNNRLSVSNINSITQDNNGTIWIGTDKGPFKIYNSSDIFNKSSIPFNKIYIDSGTGSGSVTGLLEDVTINAIAIDGANRKWIATQSNGVYLLNSNDSEILEHFTTESSPLPSDNIISLCIEPNNGVIYLGSDRGLMSYSTGVTSGADNFSNVYVYPNPVRPEYTGVITIKGLKSNSRIKITDVKGNLIIEGTSLGGQYQWNGLNHKGRQVDTGVYLVFGSSENGSEGVVTKIMIVK